MKNKIQLAQAMVDASKYLVLGELFMVLADENMHKDLLAIKKTIEEFKEEAEKAKEFGVEEAPFQKVVEDINKALVPLRTAAPASASQEGATADKLKEWYKSDPSVIAGWLKAVASMKTALTTYAQKYRAMLNDKKLETAQLALKSMWDNLIKFEKDLQKAKSKFA